jgi:hypothetical protein
MFNHKFSIGIIKRFNSGPRKPPRVRDRGANVTQAAESAELPAEDADLPAENGE